MVSIALQVRMKFQDNSDIEPRIKRFLDSLSGAQARAAEVATEAARKQVKHVRPLTEPRPGRNFKPIESVIRWRPVKSLNGDPGLNQQELNTEAGHWLVQNIGTGRSAVVHVAGRPNPTGRPAKGATYIRSIPSQKGRRIRAGLVFATGPGGTFVPPDRGQFRNQQLQLRKNVEGGPWSRTRSQAGIVIGREIEPQRFVQAGTKAGFREYRESVLAAARSEFSKPRG